MFALIDEEHVYLIECADTLLAGDGVVADGSPEMLVVSVVSDAYTRRKSFPSLFESIAKSKRIAVGSIKKL
ncbi:unnamed protein product [Cochlearia groenlandica]